MIGQKLWLLFEKKISSFINCTRSQCYKTPYCVKRKYGRLNVRKIKYGNHASVVAFQFFFKTTIIIFFVCRSVDHSVCLSVRSFFCLSVCSSVRPSVYPSVCQYLYIDPWFVCFSVYLPVHLFCFIAFSFSRTYIVTWSLEFESTCKFIKCAPFLALYPQLHSR